MNQPPRPSDSDKTKQQLCAPIEILPTQLAREQQHFWQGKVDKKLLAGGFGLAMSILSGVGIATYFSIQQSSANQHWVEHTYEVLAAIDDVSGGVKDVERGRRGYIITNDKFYLKTYNSGVRQTQVAVKLLQQLTKDNLRQQQRLEQLNLLIERRFASTQKSLDLFAENPLDRDIQIKLTNQNRQVQSTIEAKLAEIKDVEKHLQVARFRATNNSTRLILLLAVAGYLLSFGLLLTIYYLLRQENDRRQQTEAALRQAHDELETRVQERTMELAAANTVLQAEIDERWQAEAALRTSEANFRKLISLSPVAIGITNFDGKIEYLNEQFTHLFGYTLADCSHLEKWWLLAYPESSYREQVKQARLEAIATAGATGRNIPPQEWQVTCKDGSIKQIELKYASIGDKGIKIFHDITQRQQQQALVTAQNQVLEAIATGKALPEVLTILARAIEQQSSNGMSAILLTSSDGKVLGEGVAPSLPDSYNAAINKNGLPIAPISGSCGTAAYRRETVIVSDIATDPLWAAVRDLALTHGLRACWSQPIVTNTGKVLGTFAMYYRQPHYPSDRERELVEKASYLMRIAIERDLGEQALRQSERRYTSLVQAAPVGIFRTNAQGNCVYVNDRWCEIAGLTRAEALGTGWVLGIHPQDRERLFAEWYQAARQQLPFRSEYRYQRPDGTITWVFGQAVAEKGNNGEIVSYVGTITDITKRKLAETELQQAKVELETRVAQRTAQLQESEAKFRQLAETIQAVFWISDPRIGQVIYISPAYEKIWGRSSTDVYENIMAWSEAIHPEDRDRVQKNFLEQVALGLYDEEYRIIRPDGTICWIRDRGYPIHDEAGELLRVAGIAEDITQRKQAEEALRESEAKFRQLAENLDDVVWIADANHQTLYVSPAYEKIWGHSSEDLYRNSSQWLQAIHPEDRSQVEQALQQTMLHDGYSAEYRIIRADGETRWIRDRGFLIRNEAGEIYRIAGIAEDISDRKLAEAILYQRQQEFVALVENSPDVIARFDLQLRHSYINSAIEKELGIPPQAFIGKTVREMGFPTEFADTFEPALQRVLATGQEQIIELSAQTPQGLGFSQTRLMPETAPDGTINSILALGRDITAIRAAEIAQRQQREREQLIGAIAQHMRESLDLKEILNTTVTELQAFFQADRVLVYQIESNGSGKVVAEALASGWKSLLDLVLSIEAFPLATQQQYLRGKIGTICDRDTGTIPPCLVGFMHQTQVRAKLTIPIIQQHKLWGLLIVHQCSQPREWQTWESNLLQQLANQMAIAIQQSELHQQLQTELQERRQIEQALRQSETEFRLLSENSPLGIFRTNDRGEYTYINPRYQQICDCTFAEAMGRGWLQLIHPENRDFVISQNSKAVCERKSCLSEFHFVRKDGSSRYCRVQAAPLFNDETYIGHVGTIEDITESRAIAQMKNEFIGIVSHELRTPLTSLRGSLGLLATGVYDNKPEKGKRMLQVAAESAARLVRLVSDILDLERLESGKVTLEFQPCNAADLMLQSVEAMRASAEQNQVTLSFTPLQMQIWAAPDAIVQTLTNLLSNAVKFSPPGSTVWLSAEILRESGVGSRESGKRAEGEVKIQNSKFKIQNLPLASCLSPLAFHQQPTTNIIFQVKDTGRGIPADKLETIFGQFQQVDVSDSRQKGGTGLGLAICRSIIHQHGGQIWAESILNEGSSFYFTLPLNTVDS